MSDRPTPDAELEALLIRSLDPSLEAPARDRLERALAAHPDGPRERAALAAVDRLLRAPQPAPALAPLRERVLAEVASRPAPAPRRWAGGLQMLALAAVALVAAIGLLRSSLQPREVALERPGPASSRRATPVDLRPVAIAIATGELQTARQLLQQEGVDPRDPAVPSLRRLLALLEQPTAHIDQIVALAGALAKLEGRDDGVPALGEALLRLWTPEQANARLAAEGARLLAAGDHDAARSAYQRIGEASVFARLRRRGLARCQLAAAELLLESASLALQTGRPDEAERLAGEALQILPETEREPARGMLVEARQHRQLEATILEARALAARDQTSRALGLLASVPPGADYWHRYAREVAEAIQLKRVREARALYDDGRGPEALAALAGLTHVRATTLARQISRVIALREAALDAPVAEAPDLWRKLLQAEPQPANAYRLQAQSALGPEHRPSREVRATAYALRARDLVHAGGGFERRLDAALLVGRALQLDKRQSMALHLRKGIRLRIESELASVNEVATPNRKKLPYLIRLYRLATAAMPSQHPLRAKLVGAINAAGGELPEPDPFPFRLHSLDAGGEKR